MSFVVRRIPQSAKKNDDIFFDDPLADDALDADMDTDGMPSFEGGKLKSFFIDERFWYEDLASFDQKQVIHVPDCYLFIETNKAGRVAFKEVFERVHYKSDNINIEISVLNPRRLFAKHFAVGPLPDEKWFQHYRKYKTEVTMELIGLCWRHLALNRKPENVQRDDLRVNSRDVSLYAEDAIGG